jgi:hypothetical protein
VALALRVLRVADFNEVLKMSDVQQKIRNTGVEPVGGSPELRPYVSAAQQQEIS